MEIFTKFIFDVIAHFSFRSAMIAVLYLVFLHVVQVHHILNTKGCYRKFFYLLCWSVVFYNCFGMLCFFSMLIEGCCLYT